MIIFLHVSDPPSNGDLRVVGHAVPQSVIDIINLAAVSGAKGRLFFPSNGWGFVEEVPVGLGTAPIYLYADAVPKTLPSGTFLPTFPPYPDPVIELVEDFYFVEIEGKSALAYKNGEFSTSEFFCSSFIVRYATAGGIYKARTGIDPYHYEDHPLSPSLTMKKPKLVEDFDGVTIEVAYKFTSSGSGSLWKQSPFTHPCPYPLPEWHLLVEGCQLGFSEEGIWLFRDDDTGSSFNADYPTDNELAAAACTRYYASGMGHVSFNSESWPTSPAGGLISPTQYPPIIQIRPQFRPPPVLPSLVGAGLGICLSGGVGVWQKGKRK
jgi:hypothetical protein